MNRVTFFKHFGLLADQLYAVGAASCRTPTAPEERHVYRNAPTSEPSSVGAALNMENTHYFQTFGGQLMNTRLHAAPPGLSVRWETIGYKQAAPTELFTRRRS